MSLEPVRSAIDGVDDRILDLLRERAELVGEVGRLKEKSGDSYYAPEREEALLRRLVAANRSKLPEASLRAVYREILSSMRALEQAIKVAYLGPRTTFSHQAAARHFGSAVELLPERTIGEVFEAVERGRAHYGVVPIENSQEGSVSATLDRFMDSEVQICAQVFLPVELNLLGRGPLGAVRKIAPATVRAVPPLVGGAFTLGRLRGCFEHGARGGVGGGGRGCGGVGRGAG